MPAEDWKASRTMPKLSRWGRAICKAQGTCRERRTRRQFTEAQIQVVLEGTGRQKAGKDARGHIMRVSQVTPRERIGPDRAAGGALLKDLRRWRNVVRCAP